MDNLKLGYGGTKTEMERLLQDASKLSGTKYDIGNLADVYEAIHVIQNEIGITGTTAKEAASTLSGSLASMKSAFSNVLGNLALGENMTSSLNALAQTTSTFLFGNFIPMLGNIFSALPSAIVTFVQTAGPQFAAAGSGFLSQLVDGIQTELPKLFEKFKNMVIGMLALISANLPTFLEKGTEVIRSLADGILKNIPAFIAGAGEILSAFIQFILANLPAVLASGKDMVLSLVDGIIANLPAIMDSALQAIEKFIDIILANYPQYFKAGWGVIKELVGGIISRLPDIIAVAIMLMLIFVKWLLSKLPDVVEAGLKILGSIIEGIHSVSENLYSKASEIMSRLMDKINEFKDRFFEAGRNIVMSIANGIRNAMSAVTDAIGSVVQSVRDHLPFSPAKEGPLKDLHLLDFTIIADGIYRAQNPVSRAMSALAKSTLEGYDAIEKIHGGLRYKLSANTLLASDGEGDKAGGIVVNQYIYAKTEDERAQQKEAVRRLRDLLPEV